MCSGCLGLAMASRKCSVAVRPAAVLRRAAPGPGDASRVARRWIGGTRALADDRVRPVVAEVVEIARGQRLTGRLEHRRQVDQPSRLASIRGKFIVDRKADRQAFVPTY